MSFNSDWEDFYTISLNDEDLVDYISVNTKLKKYIIYIDANDLITDSMDEDGNYDENMFVSRTVFDFIVKGVEDNNYTRLIPTKRVSSVVTKFIVCKPTKLHTGRAISVYSSAGNAALSVFNCVNIGKIKG